MGINVEISEIDAYVSVTPDREVVCLKPPFVKWDMVGKRYIILFERIPAC